jgi:hypothetical protein
LFTPPGKTGEPGFSWQAAPPLRVNGYDPPKMTVNTHFEPFDTRQGDDGQHLLWQASP